MREELFEHLGCRIEWEEWRDVGWRPLQHGDLGTEVVEGGKQRDCGGAGPDNDDILSFDVRVSPLLWVDDFPVEFLAARNLRIVALGVTVIAGCHMNTS